jgi:CheY-like chemotaxis protein
MNQQQQKSIWIVDDDLEDHELIKDIFKELNWSHPLVLFETAEALLEKLNEVHVAPFIVISDINLPKIDGFELRESMLNNPNNKYHSVPFIFWSTQASEKQIRKAYELKAHGFFRKEATFEEWKVSLIKIIEYWTISLMPAKEEETNLAVYK